MKVAADCSACHLHLFLAGAPQNYKPVKQYFAKENGYIVNEKQNNNIAG